MRDSCTTDDPYLTTVNVQYIAMPRIIQRYPFSLLDLLPNVPGKERISPGTMLTNLVEKASSALSAVYDTTPPEPSLSSELG